MKIFWIILIIIAILIIWSLIQWIYLSKVETLEYKVVEEKNGYEIREYDDYLVAKVNLGKDDLGSGFKILAGYIFGDNTVVNGGETENEEIDMTTPVLENKTIAMTAPVLENQEIAMTTPVLENKEIEMTTPVLENKEIAMTSPVLENQEIDMTAPVISADEKGRVMSFVLPKEYSLEELPKPNDERVIIEKVEGRKWAVLKYSWSQSDSLKEKKLNQLKDLLEKDNVETTGVYQFAFYNPPLTLPFMLRNEVWMELK